MGYFTHSHSRAMPVIVSLLPDSPPPKCLSQETALLNGQTNTRRRRSSSVSEQDTQPQSATPRDPQEDRLVTRLLHAAEAVAEPLRCCPADIAQRSAPTHATPKPVTSQRSNGQSRPNGHGDPHAPEDDYAWLRDIVQQVRQRLGEDPRRGELLADLREAVGNGEVLRTLFWKPVAAAAAEGEPQSRKRLSKRQIQVLEAASGDLSRLEIAQKLGITLRTVDRHFENLYAKLGVHKPLQAVAMAISMGYLDLDKLDLLYGVNGSSRHNYGLLPPLIAYRQEIEKPEHADMRESLLEFGLLLLTLAWPVASLVRDDATSRQHAHTGVVCQVSPEGKVLRTFGADHLHSVGGLVIAPPQAAWQGFTPGNLFVGNGPLPIRGLNQSEVVEFTPEGRFVRAFAGGRDIATRLYCGNSLAFTAGGELLVTSGAWTDAILAFGDNGKSVRRFADCCCVQITVTALGYVYAAHYSGAGCSVNVFDAHGAPCATLGKTAPGVFYGGLAVDSRSGRVFVNRNDNGRYSIEVFDENGDPQESLAVPGQGNGLLARDAEDRLYVPCERTADIKVLSPEGGRVIRRIDLDGAIVPSAVALGEDGMMWVSRRLA